MKPSITRRYRKRAIEKGTGRFPIPQVQITYGITNFVVGSVTNASSLQIGTATPVERRHKVNQSVNRAPS